MVIGDLSNFYMTLIGDLSSKNLKYLNPSYKTDLDFWDSFGREPRLITDYLRYYEEFDQSVCTLGLHRSDINYCKESHLRVIWFVRLYRKIIPKLIVRMYGEVIPETRGLSLRTGAQNMLYLTCTMISSVGIAYYGVSGARSVDWWFNNY